MNTMHGFCPAVVAVRPNGQGNEFEGYLLSPEA